MLLAALLHHIRLTQSISIQLDFQGGEVKRVKAEFDLATDELGIDAVGVALQRDAAIFAHGAFFTPQKGFAQDLGIGYESCPSTLSASSAAFRRNVFNNRMISSRSVTRKVARSALICTMGLQELN